MLIVETVFWISGATLLYTYFGYPLLLAGLHFVLRRKASRPDDAYCPSMSIVLAAYNEETCIRQKLENCLALDYPREKLQILVGSDGSDDRTAEIAAEFRERGVEVFEFEPRRGKMATVNRLVERARGEICVFSDISERFDTDALRKLVRHFADPEIGAVTGNHLYYAEESGLGKGTLFYWKYRRFLQSVESGLGTICSCDGTIYAVRREFFCPPPDNTINDDVAVPLGVIGAGKRVIFEPEAIARGEVLKNTQRFFRQKIRSQAGRYQIFALFPRMFLPWPLGRCWTYVSHSVLPVLVPWLLALILSTNIALALSSVPLAWFYRVLLALQGGFYLMALLGLVAQRLRVTIPGTTIPFYFVTANLGSLFGFFAYLTGKQGVAWRKVE